MSQQTPKIIVRTEPSGNSTNIVIGTGQRPEKRINQK